MNVFRDDVEHAERPKMRRWASVATPNAQHLAAPATRRGRLYTREHPKRANQKIVKLCKARNAGGSDYPQYQKIEKCLPKRKRAKKNGRAAAMIRKSRSCCAEERMPKRKHPMRLEKFQTRHVALLGRGTARKKPSQGSPPPRK